MTMWNRKLLAPPEDPEADEEGLNGEFEEARIDGDDLDPVPLGRPRPAFENKDFNPLTDEPSLSNDYIDRVAPALRRGKAWAKSKMPRPGPEAIAVGRPDASPEARPFEEIQAPPEPEVSDTRTRVAADRAGGAGDGDELGAAQAMASERRARALLAQAGRTIGRAGLDRSPESEQRDQAALQRAESPVQELLARRTEQRKQTDEARQADDQRLQNEQMGMTRDVHGTKMEAAGRDRDYNTSGSAVSLRRVQQLVTMYPDITKRLPPGSLERLSAADVDVYLKELQAERTAKTSAQQGAIDRRTWLKRADAVAKGSQQFGEMDEIGKTLEDIAPGITGGHMDEDLSVGLLERGALAIPGGFGERMVDDKKVQLNNALNDLQAQIGYLRSGKVITEREETNMRRILSRLMGQPPEQMAHGVAQVWRELRQRQQNFQSSYGLEQGAVDGVTPLDAFEGKGGTSYRNGSPSAPSGGGRRATMPDGSVWEELPDGSARRVK